MAFVMVLFLPIIVFCSVSFNQTFQSLKATDKVSDFESEVLIFYPNYRKNLRIFGALTGIYLLFLFISMLLMFKKLFSLLDSDNALSATLQHQKQGLRQIRFLVVISYFFAAIIQFFYGNLNWIPIFYKWLLYPLLSIIIELPNILVLYIIHWRSYNFKQ